MTTRNLAIATLTGAVVGMLWGSITTLLGLSGPLMEATIAGTICGGLLTGILGFIAMLLPCGDKNILQNPVAFAAQGSVAGLIGFIILSSFNSNLASAELIGFVTFGSLCCGVTGFIVKVFHT